MNITKEQFLTSGEKLTIEQFEQLWANVPASEQLKAGFSYINSNKDWQEKTVSLLFLHKFKEGKDDNEYTDFFKSLPHVVSIKKWTQGKSDKFNEMELLKMARQIINTGCPYNTQEGKQMLKELYDELVRHGWRLVPSDNDSYKEGEADFMGCKPSYYRITVEKA